LFAPDIGATATIKFFLDDIQQSAARPLTSVNARRLSSRIGLTDDKQLAASILGET
jgi:hypothetical protein